MKIKTNRVLIQIGTNTGADEFNCICKYAKPSKVILVEPLVKFVSAIQMNYKTVENVFIESIAITKGEKEVTLVIPKDRPDMWGDQNFSLLPMDDWGDNLEKLVVPGMSFNELCEKYDITNVHYLQIDTEGFDAEIIKSIDFSKVNIDIIRYEKWPFPVDVFTRHGEKGKHYGQAGMDYVEKLLEGNGYVLMEELSDILAIKL